MNSFNIFVLINLLYNLDTDSWDNLIVENRKKLNNPCHSMKRFECDQISNSDYALKLNKETTDYHLFYKADSCALQVLSSIHLKISSFIFALILIFLF